MDKYHQMLSVVGHNHETHSCATEVLHGRGGHDEVICRIE